MSQSYLINEFFYSLQGEGMRAGTPNLFLRFTGCNLRCNLAEHGFNCDTEFSSGERWSLDQIVANLRSLSKDCQWLVLTGGEPTLQVDEPLIERMHREGFKLAIESNGSRPLPKGLDWICISPKGAEHTLAVESADEVKYVRAFGQGIPKPSIRSPNYLISPAFEGDHLPAKNLEWCIDLVKKNPPWRLSLQQHKFLNIR